MSVEGPRRASLAQDRSRQTRRRLVRAALDLWEERGYERGIDDTTVEEIAERAGVTKGTFYFHFAHKEDILLELGFGTADAMYDRAVKGAASRRSGTALVNQLLGELARRVEAVPPQAVLRAVSEFYQPHAPRLNPTSDRLDLHHSLAVALEAAREQGELPAGTDTDELSRMLTAVAMDAILRRAQGDKRSLRSVLRQRADTLLAGAGG